MNLNDAHQENLANWYVSLDFEECVFASNHIFAVNIDYAQIFFCNAQALVRGQCLHAPIFYTGAALHQILSWRKS